jgi:hypothetical protein
MYRLRVRVFVLNVRRERMHLLMFWIKYGEVLIELLKNTLFRPKVCRL